MVSGPEYTMDSTIFKPLHTSLSNARKKWQVQWSSMLKIFPYAYSKKINRSLNSIPRTLGGKAYLNDILSLSNSGKSVYARCLSNFTGDSQSCQDRA